MRPSTDYLLPSPSLVFFSPTSTSNLSPCQRTSTRRMATLVKKTPAFNSSLCHLSSELLALVFDQLREIDLPSLRSLRLVSRRFNDIATPIIYRSLTLNHRLVALDAEIRYPNALHHISVYSNHVIISSNLDQEGVTRILTRVRRLSSVRWRFVGDVFDITEIWCPADVLNPDQRRFMNTKLHVENLPLQDFDGPQNDFYTRAIPAKLLVSLSLASPSPALTARTGSLRHLLLQAPRLENFSYEDRGQGTSFALRHGERMPAFKNLRFRSYNWNHTGEEVRRHWDFSEIESLELISVPTFNFLKSIPFSDFSNLRILRVEDYSAHLPDKRQEATGGLYLLVKNHIRALEVLDITCHTQIFPLDAILAHAPTLRVLRFRDHVGFSEDDRQCPTLWSHDVALLARHLRHVHTLELDLDVSICRPSEFLMAVCKFPALHTLSLNVQTVIRPANTIPFGVDCDHDAATQMYTFLIQAKRASTPNLSWKRVTLNVGGWKPIMVRRLGSEWYEHNANGIYAERLFVMERNADGEHTIREQLALETPSRRNTPDLDDFEQL